jgi:phenylalanyl-tRNA synthetase beta chain
MSSVIRPASFALKRNVREYLAAKGFSEAVNYGFCSPAEAGLFAAGAPVMISNPLGVEFSQMKPSLLIGLLTNLKFNISNGQDVVRLFELRPIFRAGIDGVLQKLSLAGIIFGLKRDIGWAAPNADSDFFDIKGTVESLIRSIRAERVEQKEGTNRLYFHPTASITFVADEEELGVAGQIHPEIASKWEIDAPVFAFELDWEKLAKASSANNGRFVPIAKFPVVRRDIALMMADGIVSEKLIREAFNLKSDIIRSVFPFDVYKGKGIPEGKKSVAYAVLYSHPERTLTDEEVNDAHARLVAHLKDKLGAEVR